MSKKILVPVIESELNDNHDEDDSNTIDFSSSSYTSQELEKIVTDLMLPHSTRLEAFNILYLQENHDILSLINKLSITYIMSQASIILKFLYDISIDKRYDISIRIEIAKTLAMEDEKGYSSLNIICHTTDFNKLTLSYQAATLIFFMQSEKYKDISVKLFESFINNEKVDPDYRYKTFLSLETKIEGTLKEFYSKILTLSFLSTTTNHIRYRILASQYFLQKNSKEETLSDKIQELLFSFANDTDLDYNVRADATDVILRLGSKNNKELARDIIMNLGITKNKQGTIYDNAQNVHNDTVENSILSIIEKLYENVKTSLNWKNVSKKIKGYIKVENLNEINQRKVKLALNRIYNDRALYTRYNIGLVSVFLKVVTYIESSTYKEELVKRLLQELIHMSETCSTGYISNMVNTLSGFADEFGSVRISWEDQIKGNLAGRLTKIIRDIENEEERDKILEEMTKEEYEDKINFLKIFRKNLSSIRDELWNEFKEHITDTDFDLYFRKAIMSYEGYN